MASKNINDEIQAAIYLASQGKIIEARYLLEMLSKKNKKNTDILMLLAELNSKTGELNRALKYYKKIIELAPRNKQAHTNLGMLFHSRGDSLKAEQQYKKSLKLDNNQPIVNFNLGSVLQEQKKLEEAKQRYQQAISLNPAYAKAYSNLGYIQRQQGELDAAIDSYKQAIKHAPNIPEISYNLGLSLLQKGQPDDAEQCQRNALKLQVNYSDAWAGLGAVQLYRDDSEKAMDSFKQALTCDSNNVKALCGLAQSLSRRGMHEQAIKQIENALLIEHNNNEARYIQGQVFLSLGRLDEALGSCSHILEHTPKDKRALSLAASIYEKKGLIDKAYEYLKPLLKESSVSAETVLSFASISNKINRVEDAIRMMEDVLENDSQLQSNTRRHLYFQLGKAYDGLCNYEKAFSNYQLGNQLKLSNFDISSLRQIVDDIISVFNRETLSNHSLKSSGEPYVFIVGMPRSGTSLVEQIISSHPQVFGAGELQGINDIVSSMQSIIGSEKNYPECVTQAEQKDLTKFAKSYADQLNNLDPDALRITDKLPTNFFHIGLIQMLFPNARIIHCMRNPLDTCLSCYFQDFGGDYPWIYDLDNLALVYNEYIRIMHYWQHKLGVPIFNVRYEELVENQEMISKELINHIGLEWDDRCLKFHENRRFIWTASYNQVRQPMYKKSVSRWKNYEQQLSRVISVLGDVSSDCN